jgi:hypothetical protein
MSIGVRRGRVPGAVRSVGTETPGRYAIPDPFRSAPASREEQRAACTGGRPAAEQCAGADVAFVGAENGRGRLAEWRSASFVGAAPCARRGLVPELRSGTAPPHLSVGGLPRQRSTAPAVGRLERTPVDGMPERSAQRGACNALTWAPRQHEAVAEEKPLGRRPCHDRGSPLTEIDESAKLAATQREPSCLVAGGTRSLRSSIRVVRAGRRGCMSRRARSRRSARVQVAGERACGGWRGRGAAAPPRPCLMAKTEREASRGAASQAAPLVLDLSVVSCER